MRSSQGSFPALMAYLSSSSPLCLSSRNLLLVFYVCLSASLISQSSCCRTLCKTPIPSVNFTLESVRDSLVRQEDTIVFSLIERSKYPHNSPAYDPSYFGGAGGSLVEFFVRESEVLGAKAGRYQNPEEVPFFPDNLPMPLVPPVNFSRVLYPPAASVTALSRRIHYGKFVAEVKFRDAPQDYTPAIHAQDRDALMKLLTSESVEESVKNRVAKKAKVFGQDVTLDDKANKNCTDTMYKVCPSTVYRLYEEWVIPLTKLVEVEYLLHRLD